MFNSRNALCHRCTEKRKIPNIVLVMKKPLSEREERYIRKLRFKFLEAEIMKAFELWHAILGSISRLAVLHRFG